MGGGLCAFEEDAGDAAVLERVAAQKAAALKKAGGTPGFQKPAVRFVSLGHNFAPKIAFDRLGLAEAEALPFDWTSTRLEGILECLRTDFAKFLDTGALKDVSYGSNGDAAAARHAFCGSSHSFWYNDLRKEGTVADYEKRVVRMRGLRTDVAEGKSLPILFVRVAATGATELPNIGDLLTELKARFGPQVYLLYVLDYQKKAEGPAVVKDEKSLLLYYLRRDPAAEAAASKSQGGMNALAAVYSKPIEVALNWLTGKPFSAIPFSNIGQAATCADVDASGLCGFDGLPAFTEQKS